MDFLKNLFKRKPRIEKIDLTRRFDLVGRVGQGSMSKVWRARDLMTGKTFALKILDKEKTKRLESRFVGLNKPTEGEIALQFQHPHLVQTLEHGYSQDGEQFLIMEFVEGLGLSYLVDTQNDVMKENRLKFMVQLGKAISYFHKQGYIHRDICPRNVLIDQEQQLKLIDFGLAVPDTPEFKKPGNRTGTANYMAPELIKRQHTDQRIDIFSYAVTCYEMYTCQFPWDVGETNDALGMAVQHMNSPPNDIRDHLPELDDQIASAIMKGLENNPNDRWATVDAMLAELQEARKRLEDVDDDDEDWESQA